MNTYLFENSINILCRKTKNIENSIKILKHTHIHRSTEKFTKH